MSDRSGPAWFRLDRWRIVLVLLSLCLLGTGGCETAPDARFITQIPWMEEGEWIKADTHIHTRFSDGAHGLDEIVLKAKEFGCGAMAITDHADRNLSAATPEYAEAILAARRSHPDLIILAGLEWNVPPGGGDDHANLLVPPGPDEFLTLAEFKDQFDDLDREEHDSERATAAFRWLSQTYTNAEILPILTLNHPSRVAIDSQTLAHSLRQWRTTSNLLVGLEGAPGHQKVNGSYKSKLTLIDRWDPAAAEVGGVWDELLGRGADVWGAHAHSDFHSPSMDYWPGEFSETWLYVPERTAEGVLKAMHAGAFFGGHGHIAREVELKVHAQGLSRPAYAGETIEVTTGSDLDLELSLEVPSVDWEGQPNRIDRIELIAITADGARVIADDPFPTGESYKRQLKNLRAGFVLRARGRRIVANGPDVMFYTNPIRIETADQSLVDNTRKLLAGRVTWKMVWGGGLAILLVTAMAVGVAKYLDSREEIPADVPYPPGTPPKRRHVFVAAVAFLLLAMYGSLVPLNSRPGTFDEAWAYFWHHQSWQQPDFSNRSDWGANTLLYIPIGFCWLGFLCLDKRGLVFKSMCFFVVLAFCLATSFGIEFTQYWVDARVPSHDDVYAQVVGTLVGLMGWLIFGQSFINWWRLHTSQHNRHRLLAAVLSCYVLGLVAYSLVPLDLLIHPAELYKKYRDGRIVLVPQWPNGMTLEHLWGMLTDVITYLPVGVWSSLIWNADNHRRSWLRSVLIGGGVAVGIEIAQVFVVSRFAEVSDLLPAFLGIALGAAGVSYVLSQKPTQSTSQDRKLLKAILWWGGVLLYAGFLVVFFCWPLELDHDPVRIQKDWSNFFRVPMTALYWSTEYNAATQIIRKLLMWSVLGILVSVPVYRNPLPKAVRFGFLCFGWFFCFAVGTGIELFQLLMPVHTPDSTDIGLYGLGAALGIWGTRWWHHHSRPSVSRPGARDSRVTVSSPG